MGIIEIEHLTKKYGENIAVDDISFSVEAGEIVGFLGRNGAGKTTTMNILTGYISATQGSVTIDGHDILLEPLKAKACIGYMPEHPPLYPDLTIDEYLKFSCSIKGVDKAKRESHIEEICALVGLSDVRQRLIRNMSKGYRQRIGFAQALIGSPKVLIFDEPTIGLDPLQIIDIRKLIKSLSKKHTVILSSHILTEVSEICERVIIIDKGKLVAQDTLANLSKGVGDTFRLLVRVDTTEKSFVKHLKSIPGIRKADVIGVKEPGTLDFFVESDKDKDMRRQIFKAVNNAGAAILLFKPMDVTLEDIFLRLTVGM